MALGYTIATILKRVSKVFSDDVLCIKIDKLELLQQKFIQVNINLCSIYAFTFVINLHITYLFSLIGI